MTDFPAPPAAAAACPDPTRASWAKDLALVAIVSLLWFCALLGMRPLGNPDEGRYSEIPREMAVTGDFVTPRLDGVKYFEKPPLLYWLSALTFRSFGVSEFTARVWNALFAALGVLLTYTAGRWLYGRRAGIAAAIVLATSLMYYIMSQIVLLDMAVAVTISGALFAFIMAVREPRGGRRLGLFAVFYIFIALATLSKGLIGIALPGAVIFLWVLLLNRWKQLWPFYPIIGMLIVLAIAAPWHVLAARANPDFLNFYFYHEHWLRFTTRVHGRYEPFWFFVPVLLLGLFPWIFLAWPAARNALRGGWKARLANQEAWFLMIWTAFVFLFFSKSQSKLIPYLLPIFPAAAVLIGKFLSTARAADLRAGGRAFAIVFALLAIAVFVIPTPKNQPELAATLPLIRVLAGIVLLGGAVAVFIFIRRENANRTAAAMAISTAAFLAVITFGSGSFHKSSNKQFATILTPKLNPGDRVYSIGFYAQDLPVYLNRLIDVVDYRGELAYGIDAEPELTSKRFISPEDLTQRWMQPGAAYAVIRRSAFDRWFSKSGVAYEILAENRKFLLVAKPQSAS